jgi:hypothetical protein
MMIRPYMIWNDYDCILKTKMDQSTKITSDYVSNSNEYKFTSSLEPMLTQIWKQSTNRTLTTSSLLSDTNAYLNWSNFLAASWLLEWELTRLYPSEFTSTTAQRRFLAAFHGTMTARWITKTLPSQNMIKSILSMLDAFLKLLRHW